MPTCALASVKLTMTDNRGGETPETRIMEKVSLLGVDLMDVTFRISRVIRMQVERGTH